MRFLQSIIRSLLFFVIPSVSEESPLFFFLSSPNSTQLSSPNVFIGDPDQFFFITEINLLVNYFFYFLNSVLYGNNKLFLVLWIPAFAGMTPFRLSER